MKAVSSKLGLLLLLLVPSCLAVPPNPLGPSRPQKKSECRSNLDCPAYSYCHTSLFLGSRCLTQFRQKSHYSTAYCLQILNYKKVPDHKRCQNWEAENEGISKELTVSRCYAELGYTCATAYLTPCTEEFDFKGDVVEKDVCPDNFECVKRTFKDNDERKVCSPIQPKDARARTCEHAYDCGFSLLSNSWSRCSGGSCLRPIE